MFPDRYAIIAAVTLMLTQAPPAGASHPAPPLPATVASAAAQAPPLREAAAAGDADAGVRLLSGSAAVPAEPWKKEFTFTPSSDPVQYAPAHLVQRGEFRVKGMSLLAEMGDIRISETSNTIHDHSRRGGRLALETGNSGNALRLGTFASSGAGPAEGMLLGATAEMSLLAESARFKTIYLSERQALQPGVKPAEFGERRGDVLGFVAVLEPFQGKLGAEAELDLAVYDPDSADEAAAYRDTTCRLKVAGEWGRYRYQALYERTGPDYRLMGGKGPRRDSEGVSLGLETSFRVHALDLKLSRYHNNTEQSPLYPRVNRYEGSLDYSLKAFEALPLGVRYRKTFIDSEREPLGYLPREAEEDAVSGRVNYLAGRWDLGLLASYWQRTDRIREAREASAATLAFLPKFAAGPWTVAPDFSLKRSMDFATSLRTDQYAVGLGVNGSALEKRVDYELRGGFQRESSGVAASWKQTLGANLRAFYPLVNLFKSSWQPTIGLRGEYSAASDTSAGALSLVLSVEGRSLL